MTVDELPLAPIFEAIGSRLDLDNRAAKKNYAEKFSRQLALLFATHLATRYPAARVTPNSDGTGQEFKIGGDIDAKRTDVAVWDDRAGLVLGISIKTITARDAATQRYTKNVLRNDMELRDEADKLHRRQPYAYLAAIIFLPLDSTWDGRGQDASSSFAHAVFSFRKRSGRATADSSHFDHFEKIFIGLFEDGGAVYFFDVNEAPRRNQPPAGLLTLTALLDRIGLGARARHQGDVENRFAADDPDWVRPETQSLLVASADDVTEDE